jgi:hypothetical protein
MRQFAPSDPQQDPLIGTASSIVPALLDVATAIRESSKSEIDVRILPDQGEGR